MHKQGWQSPQKINQPTYSSSLNNSNRTQKPPVQSSPFQMITTEQNFYEVGNHLQSNLQSYRGGFYRHFARQDLHRNPLAESVQGEKEKELGDSQVVCRTKLEKQSYLAQYQVDQEDIKEQIISPTNSSKQEEQIPHRGFTNVFTTPFIYSYQNLQSQLDSKSLNHLQNTKVQCNYIGQNQSNKQTYLPYQKDYHPESLNYSSSNENGSTIQHQYQLIKSLESRIHVLEQQKSQLSKQVTKLNSIIEKLRLNANNTSKEERKNIHTSQHPQQTSLVKISTVHQLTPPYQLSYNTLHAELQSVPVQTSFIDPITQNFDQFNYKRLYQKQIEYQQRVKQQMYELQMLQYAYDEQFKKVIQQIQQIKKNRNYYQQLKKQIKKEKSRSNSKNYQITSPLKQLPKTINTIQANKSTQPSPMMSRIFQNQIIYQLKTENQILKANLQKITNLIIGKQNTTNSLHQQHFHQSQHSHLASHRNFAKSLMKNPVTHSVVLNETKNPNSIKYDLQFAKLKDKSISKITIVEKLKKRPHSISQLSILHDKKESLNKFSVNKSRKNGSISNISSNDMNYNKINTSQQMQKRISLSASQYKNNLISSEKIKNTSLNQISQPKSSHFTQQQNHEMIISRYNNFIKNMKKKFGITSQIIGKQIN